MADVYDRWHKSHPKQGETRCRDHRSRTRVLVPTAEHGVGKRWQVRYRDPSSEQRKENFETKAAADNRAAEVEHELNRGTFIDPNAGKEAFRVVAERWRAGAVHRGSTAERVERSLRLHIAPTFGDRQIASIRTSDIQAWVKDRSHALAPTTLAMTYATLTAVFRAAHLDRSIPFNPCDGVRLPVARRPEVVPLGVEVVAALVEAAPSWYRALLMLATASGLRQGELFGLELKHIDFREGTVTVEQQLVGPDKGAAYIGEPKTHESYRTVPVAKQAMATLAAHLERFPARRVDIEDRTDPRKPRQRKAQLVFVNERGDAIRRGSWSHMWENLKDVADKALAGAHAAAYAKWVRRGRPEGKEPSLLCVPAGASMHDLRHFYASVLIMHRETVKTVQKRLGHAKPSITLDTYTHLWPSGEDTTRAAMESIFDNVPSMCPPAPVA